MTYLHILIARQNKLASEDYFVCRQYMIDDYGDIGIQILKISDRICFDGCFIMKNM